MDQRISVITLGVGDLAAARGFYEKLGWHSDSPVEEDVVFFQAGDLVIGLWGREQLAEDSAVSDAGGWGGVTLAYNVASPGEVDEVIDVAEQAGAHIGRRGAPTFWGGYSGVFMDPDGHPWEVAHNPFWTITDTGAVRLPGGSA